MMNHLYILLNLYPKGNWYREIDDDDHEYTWFLCYKKFIPRAELLEKDTTNCGHITCISTGDRASRIKSKYYLELSLSEIPTNEHLYAGSYPNILWEDAWNTIPKKHCRCWSHNPNLTWKQVVLNLKYHSSYLLSINKFNRYNAAASIQHVFRRWNKKVKSESLTQLLSRQDMIGDKLPTEIVVLLIIQTFLLDRDNAC
jgi:hypothetical protein